jgi:hypothetical protein
MKSTRKCLSTLQHTNSRALNVHFFEVICKISGLAELGKSIKHREAYNK